MSGVLFFYLKTKTGFFLWVTVATCAVLVTIMPLFLILFLSSKCPRRFYKHELFLIYKILYCKTCDSIIHSTVSYPWRGWGGEFKEGALWCAPIRNFQILRGPWSPCQSPLLLSTLHLFFPVFFIFPFTYKFEICIQNKCKQR